MPSVGKRRVFQLDACFDAFIARHWRDAHFLSITFAENVTDKDVAERSWRPVREWFNRKDVAYLGVWENQARGAWHLHLVLSRYIDIREFREFAVCHGWGPIMRIDRILVKVDDFNAPDPKQLAHQVDRVKRYLLKYLKKGHRSERSGAKLSVYSKGCRLCTMTFAFAWEMGGRLWASGREVFESVYGRPPRWCDADTRRILRLGFEFYAGAPEWERFLMWSPYDIEFG